MKLVPRRRRRPKTLFGKIVRAWPWIRLGLKVGRLVRRARRAMRAALVTAFGGVVFAIVRRLRRRRSAELPTYSPAPATPAGWGGGTRETGYEAGPGTETERRLEAEKTADGDGAARDKGPTIEEESPPVEDEPPTRT